MDEQRSFSRYRLTVDAASLAAFTTMLQSGVKITIPGNMSLLQILTTLPGFTVEYLSTAVQTIFHNAAPVDDMLIIPERDAVIALSAAMPGLAGAIFRKHSVHAALRSTTSGTTANSRKEATTITLKLFNSIALDRGGDLLAYGVTISAKLFGNFFQKRPHLREAIREIRRDQEPYSRSDFFALLDSASGDIGLQLVSARDDK